MQARRVVLAILALPVLCAPRTVAGDLSAVAHGPRPRMVSNFGPDWRPRLPGVRGNGTSLGPRALAFEIGARLGRPEVLGRHARQRRSERRRSGELQRLTSSFA